MAVDDVYLLTVSATQLSSLRQNTLAFRLTTEDLAEAADFATIAVAFKEVHRAVQSAGVTYTSWKARQIRGAGVTWPDSGTTCTPTGGQFFEGLFSTNTAGLDLNNDILPPQCALVTTLRSGQIGRSHRGRVFAYGFTEQVQQAGQWISAMLTPLGTAWTTFMSAYADDAPASGYQLGIWSQRIASGCRQLPGGGHERTGPSNEAAAFTPAISHTIRTTVYTQRRRVTGYGL
jgi:hypothetical protein